MTCIHLTIVSTIIAVKGEPLTIDTKEVPFSDFWLVVLG